MELIVPVRTGLKVLPSCSTCSSIIATCVVLAGDVDNLKIYIYRSLPTGWEKFWWSLKMPPKSAFRSTNFYVAEIVGYWPKLHRRLNAHSAINSQNKTKLLKLRGSVGAVMSPILILLVNSALPIIHTLLLGFKIVLQCSRACHINIVFHHHNSCLHNSGA